MVSDGAPSARSGREFEEWCWHMHVVRRYSYRFIAEKFGVDGGRVMRAVSRHERGRRDPGRG